MKIKAIFRSNAFRSAVRITSSITIALLGVLMLYAILWLGYFLDVPM